MQPLTPSSMLTVAYGALAVADTWLSGSRSPRARRARLVTKPLLMPTLATSLALDPRARRSPLRTSTLVAQVGGWGGDVALLRSGTKPFLVGAGSFALGHASYVSGFLRHRNPAPIASAAGPRAVAASWLLSGPALALLAGRQHRELGAPVLAYAAGLAAMVATAVHLDPTLPRSARRLIAVGAWLFMVSDTVLAIRKFALCEPSPAPERVVMATYTSAQLLLSAGAARA